MKGYFGGTNSANTLRNSVAFHYSPKEIADVLTEVNDPLIAYLDNTAAPNNLFYYAEVLVSHAIVSLVGLKETETPLAKLTEELFQVGANFVGVADGLMEAIISHNGRELRSKEPEVIELDGPEFQEVWVPWFSNTSNLK